MGVSSLPKTVTRQRRDCDLNPGPSVLEITLTTRLPSHPRVICKSVNPICKVAMHSVVAFVFARRARPENCDVCV